MTGPATDTTPGAQPGLEAIDSALGALPGAPAEPLELLEPPEERKPRGPGRPPSSLTPAEKRARKAALQKIRKQRLKERKARAAERVRATRDALAQENGQLSERNAELEEESDDEEPKAPELTTAELSGLLAMLFGVGFRIIAARRGAVWMLQPDESKQLGDAWAPVVAPYLSSVSSYLPIAAAAAVTYGVLEPRLRGEATGATERAEQASADQVRTTGAPVQVVEAQRPGPGAMP